jgi:hypothetical protein
MKPLVDQLPFVNTGKPAVKSMMMQKAKATGVEYSAQSFEVSRCINAMYPWRWCTYLSSASATGACSTADPELSWPSSV